MSIWRLFPTAQTGKLILIKFVKLAQFRHILGPFFSLINHQNLEVKQNYYFSRWTATILIEHFSNVPSNVKNETF